MKAQFTYIAATGGGKYEVCIHFWDDVKRCGVSCFLYRGTCSQKHAERIAKQYATDFNIPFQGENDWLDAMSKCR